MTRREKAEYYLPHFEIVEKSAVIISTIIPFCTLLIGASFQIFYLWKIDIFYIRFFSLSQLLSDSIVSLYHLFIYFLPPFILGSIIPTYQNYKLLTNKETDETLRNKDLIDQKQKKNMIKTFLIMFTSFVLFLTLIKLIYSNTFIPLLSLLGGQILAYSFLINNFRKIYRANIYYPLLYEYKQEVEKIKEKISSLNESLSHNTLDNTSTYEEKQIEKQLEFYNNTLYSIKNNILRKEISKFDIFIAILAILVAFAQLFFLTERKFLPEKSFYNYKNLHSNFQKKGYKDSVLYFNDNYIFVKLQKDSTEKIAVLKFDAFFEEEKDEKQPQTLNISSLTVDSLIIKNTVILPQKDTKK